MVELFHIDVDDFAKALESVFQGKATVLYRMRLSCAFFDKGGDNIGKGEGIFHLLPSYMQKINDP